VRENIQEKPESITNILMFDYDGTLTLENSVIPESTIRTLEEVKSRGLAILGIVSGRDLSFLMRVNDSLSGVFSFLVAENGAVTYFKDTGEKFVKGLEWTRKAREVFADVDFPVRFSEVMATTNRENAAKVMDNLRLSKLDAKLVPNRDSLIVLPPSVDKGTGVASAVEHYGSTKNIRLTCFGDGENDEALFGSADVSVAVSNAVESLKKIADVVVSRPGGYGVEEYLKKNVLMTRG